jgi:hypothetical protein
VSSSLSNNMKQAGSVKYFCLSLKGSAEVLFYSYVFIIILEAIYILLPGENIIINNT